MGEVQDRQLCLCLPLRTKAQERAVRNGSAEMLSDHLEERWFVGTVIVTSKVCLACPRSWIPCPALQSKVVVVAGKSKISN